MRIGKPTFTLGCELPIACGPAHRSPLLEVIHQIVFLQIGEVLANGHRGELEPLAKCHGGGGAPHFQLQQDAVSGTFRHGWEYLGHNPINQ